MTQDDLVKLAKWTALQHDLQPELVCAVVEQETAWNPWATRYESNFYTHYILPLNISATEAHLRAISWGLMQIMGQTARELGFQGESLAMLADPGMGLEFGCRKLAQCVRAYGSGAAALLHYNGGADAAYPSSVLARVNHYR